MTVRQRLARIAEHEAHRIAAAYLDALDALDAHGRPDHVARLRAASALLAEAFGRPAQSVTVVDDQPDIVFITEFAPPLQEAELRSVRETGELPRSMTPADAERIGLNARPAEPRRGRPGS